MNIMINTLRMIPTRFTVLFVCLALFQSVNAQQDSEYSKETQELLDNLALKVQVTAAAIHENESLAGNEKISNYSIHIPSASKLELGMELDTSEPQNGFKVLSIEKDSLAEDLGLRPNDVIVIINHFEVNDVNSAMILGELQSLRPGDTLTFVVNQRNELNRLTMTVVKKPIPAVNLYVGTHEVTNSVGSAVSESFQGFDDTTKAFETTRTSNSRIESGYDDSLDFSQYETYDLRGQTAFKHPEFSDLLGLTFSAAIEQQMLSRGYIKSENPDFLINVSVNLIDKQRAPNQRGYCPDYADYYTQKPLRYYRYSGRKQARLAESRRTFCVYSEGSIKIDMVDVKLKRTIWEGVSNVRVDEKERGFLSNGYTVNDADGSIEIEMDGVKQRSTFKFDNSRLTDDEIDKGFLVKGYILDDVATMFEGSPFRERKPSGWNAEYNPEIEIEKTTTESPVKVSDATQGTIVNAINKPVSMACWIPVHVYNIDGKNIQTSPPSFKIDQGTHVFKVRIDPGHRNPNCLAPSSHFSATNIQRYRIEPFEIEVEAGKSYYIGLNAEDRVRRNWEVEVWKVN